MLVASAAYNIKRLVKHLDEHRKSQEIALGASLRSLTSLVASGFVRLFSSCQVA